MESVTTALTTGFTDVAANMTETVTAALPIALGVVGLKMAVTYGINFFKSIAGRK